MITVVVPYYNESESIVLLLGRIKSALESTVAKSYELLVVDNGSSLLKKNFLLSLPKDFPQLRVLSLSRNFGYQGALWAGLDYASGDTVIFIDGDGEDPPELIPEFIKKQKEGFDVVYGIRASRKVRWYYNLCYLAFYRLLAMFSSVKIPLDAGEFGLVSGKALVALRSFQDRTRMLRILRAWVGYQQVGIPYHREPRIGGQSKFSFFNAFSFAWDGFVSATDLPVIFSIYCSVFCFLLGLFGSGYYIFWYFYGQEKIPGFASLNITMLFLFSMLFACIAALSKYLMTLLHETRRRPPYLVDDDCRPDPLE